MKKTPAAPVSQTIEKAIVEIQTIAADINQAEFHPKQSGPAGIGPGSEIIVV